MYTAAFRCLAYNPALSTCSHHARGFTTTWMAHPAPERASKYSCACCALHNSDFAVSGVMCNYTMGHTSLIVTLQSLFLSVSSLFLGLLEFSNLCLHASSTPLVESYHRGDGHVEMANPNTFCPAGSQHICRWVWRALVSLFLLSPFPAHLVAPLLGLQTHLRPSPAGMQAPWSDSGCPSQPHLSSGPPLPQLYFIPNALLPLPSAPLQNPTARYSHSP